jgi:hypothetical protein
MSMRTLQTGRWRTLLGAAVLGTAMLAGSAEDAEAQVEAEVIYACYIPGSGVVYRVAGDGAPLAATSKKSKKGKSAKDGCKSGKHVLFSWNSVGPEGDPGARGEQGVLG